MAAVVEGARAEWFSFERGERSELLGGLAGVLLQRVLRP